MITEELEHNIQHVRLDARRRGLEQVTVEHLTLVLVMKNSAVRELLVDCQADVAGIKNKLTAYLASRAQMKPYEDEPKLSTGFQRVIKRAIEQAEKRKNQQKITGVHILESVFAEPESFAAYYLQKYGVERLYIVTHLARQGGEVVETKKPEEKNRPTELVAMAAAGTLDKPLARTLELDNIVHVLCRKYKNNPLLVGEPGVGKTALVHGLAHKIAADEVPPKLKNMRIMPVSVAALVAGTKYRGDFEQRVNQIVEKCRAHGNTAIFIDEIHTLIGAGAVSSGALDAANILKSLLNEEGVRYIGATTYAEYRRIFQKDGALARRFQKIDIHEPDDETLNIILEGVVANLGVHYSAAYDADAIPAAIDAAHRYLPNRALPDKAIDLLDDAGARRYLLAEGDAPISKTDIQDSALRAAGLSVAQAPGEDGAHPLFNLQRRLSAAVFDQEEAAARLARAVLRTRLGYDEGDKTVGAFLFIGPTGVGKTEMAKQLALSMESALLRYDMSEYMEPHTLSRLIGAPPGYVGYEQSGKLVEDIYKRPNAVVLFDEVEKAHPAVLNILLQMLDYGTLTDNAGRVADFSNAMIIMTSNLGAAEMERGVSGYAREDTADLGAEAVSRHFSPELRNRLNAVISFQPLSAETIDKIVDARLRELKAGVAAKKNIRLTIGAKLVAALKKDGFSKTMGARPLERLLAERVTEPLALAEAAGAVNIGRRVRLDWVDGETVVRAVVVKQRVAEPA